jgi:hypothetical protein
LGAASLNSIMISAQTHYGVPRGDERNLMMLLLTGWLNITFLLYAMQ